jgi:hypothetical protein
MVPDDNDAGVARCRRLRNAAVWGLDQGWNLSDHLRETPVSTSTGRSLRQRQPRRGDVERHQRKGGVVAHLRR